jgi:hypothetical protein
VRSPYTPRMQFRVSLRLPISLTLRCTQCGAEASGPFSSGLADATEADDVFDAPTVVEIDGCPECEPEDGPDEGEAIPAE